MLFKKQILKLLFMCIRYRMSFVDWYLGYPPVGSQPGRHLLLVRYDSINIIDDFTNAARCYTSPSPFINWLQGRYFSI
jgi:hypothetical protein